MEIDPLNFDLRAFEAQSAISALRIYLSKIEAQMEHVYKTDKEAHEKDAPKGGDEEEHDLHRQISNHIDRVYQDDLIPAMRYSFVVLVHILFENHLRQFCSEIKKDRKLTLSLSDISGGPIDRSRTYLSKVASLPVENFPEWQNMKALQKVRDCIVHGYGWLNDLKQEKDKDAILEVAKQNTGLAIDSGRVTLEKRFCEWSLETVDKFFEKLFIAAGWYAVSKEPSGSPL